MKKLAEFIGFIILIIIMLYSLFLHLFLFIIRTYRFIINELKLVFKKITKFIIKKDNK